MRHKLFIQFCFFCAVIFAAVSSFAQNDVDIPQLLKEAKQKSDENWQTMLENYPNYTYKWKRIWRTADKKGKVEERSDAYEIFMPLKCGDKKCRAVSILFEENGKPVSAEKLEKERIKAGEKLEKLESDKNAEAFPRKREFPSDWMRFAHFVRQPFSGDFKIIVKLDGQEILEKCEFFSPEIEQINGREAVALKFRPLANAAFSAETNYLQNAEGKIWIDARDKVIFRLAVWQKGAQFEKETSDYLLDRAAAVYDMTRVEGNIWYFRFAEIRGLKNSSLFVQMKDDFSIEHFDYHFFKTEIKEVQIKN